MIATAMAAGIALSGEARGHEAVSWRHVPRWRGFNLTEMFWEPGSPYLESDFDMLAGWKFNFVRLPLDYRIWTIEPGRYREDGLKVIDRAVAWGRERGIHVDVCLHRAPGYCVSPPKEKFDLWADSPGGEEARRQFAATWRMLAERYRGIPSSEVSFNLVNEPGFVSSVAYLRAAKAAVEAIRSVSPDRLILADGVFWGTRPVPDLIPLKIAQSTRGYTPMELTHYQASWVPGSDKLPVPTWPLTKGGYDKDKLRQVMIEPWKAFEAKGAGVHVGEWGCHNRTPHAVVLAWMRDQLSLWREAGWGWAMWNLRGSFGPLDSERADVKYESFNGHKLDREMLELLRQG
jgi:endoglucanase